MTYFNLILITIILLGMTSISAVEYKIVEAESGKPYDLTSMTKELLNYDVIFFGELHDDALLHKLEADLFEKLASSDKKIVLSMEMFERDNQDILNKYINGEISYQDFSEQARLWPNHETDYEPLLQIAIKHKRDVIAANVPRKYASLLAKEGQDALAQIPDDEKKYISQDLLVLDDRYKTEFYNTMKGMFDHGMPNKTGQDRILNIYKAQCLKDDTMAESMHKYLQDNPKSKILHINGDFHSRYFLGTAQKLALMDGNLKIAVIAPVTFSVEDKLEWSPEYSDAGDFLILIHREDK